jgi:phosphate:Na+ symporter
MMSFGKTEKNKIRGGVITGFGLLFVGLIVMEYSMSAFAESEILVNFLDSIDNIFILLIIGVILTAIVQSSSVVTTLAITMVVTGLIDLEQGIYLTLGSNVGSCVVAIIAGLSGGLNARRTAMIHLLFNVFGVLIFVVAGIVMGLFGTGYASVFEGLFPGVPSTQLAMFHTFFNVVTVIIMLPLTGKLIDLVMRLVPDKGIEEADGEDGVFTPRLYYINEYMLRTPPMAVQQVMNEVLNMSHIAMENYRTSCHMICCMDFKDMERFCNNE